MYGQDTSQEYLTRWANLWKLATTIPEEMFVINIWCTERKGCGTVACIAGHAAMHPWFRERGLRVAERFENNVFWMIRDINGNPKNSAYTHLDFVKSFFGYSRDKNDIMLPFWPESYMDDLFLELEKEESDHLDTLATFVTPELVSDKIESWMYAYWDADQVQAAMADATATYSHDNIIKYSPYSEHAELEVI